MPPPPLAAVPLLFLVATAACSAVAESSADGRCRSPAPLEGRSSAGTPGYIVVFRDGTDARVETDRLARRLRFTPRHVYTSAILGFAATLTAPQLAAVRCTPSVRYVEHDAPASTAGTRTGGTQ